MRQRSSELLPEYMKLAGLSQADLAKLVDCDRQYIHMLYHGQRKSCGAKLARRIEEKLRVLPGTIFVEEKSPTSKRSVPKRKTAAA
jgi:transcriptional regulator with XRE-family HTH domain